MPRAGELTLQARTSRLAEIARLAVRDTAGATALALAARADGLADPLVHHLIGLQLKEAGRFEDAIVELGSGLAIDPKDSRLMTTVGFCLIELGRRREAAKVFETAVRLDPASAEASYGYGWAAEGIGALEAAESAFKRTLALEPNHADALAGLAGLAVRRRDWEIARSYALRATSLDSRQTDALMNLARIEIGVADFPAAEKRLRETLALPFLRPLARAHSLIMLGDALDGQQKYREALEAYAEGKGELARLHADAFARPDMPSAADAARDVMDEFLASPSELWSRPAASGEPSPARGHVFLLGFPRSGTTLLEQVLAAHPLAQTLGERPLLLDAELEFLTRGGGVTRLANVVPELLEPFRESYWRRVREFGVDPHDTVFVDKHPLNTIRLPLISKVFPHAKILFVMRDPRDVIVSCFRRSFNMNFSMYEFNAIERAAKYYDAVMRAGEAYAEHLPLDLLRVRYETLVSDFETSTRTICDFLEIPWSDQMTGFAQNARSRLIATPSGTQVGRGLYTEGVDQWRNYAFALEPVAAILAPWIAKFGYEPA